MGPAGPTTAPRAMPPPAPATAPHAAPRPPSPDADRVRPATRATRTTRAPAPYGSAPLQPYGALATRTALRTRRATRDALVGFILALVGFALGYFTYGCSGRWPAAIVSIVGLVQGERSMRQGGHRRQHRDGMALTGVHRGLQLGALLSRVIFGSSSFCRRSGLSLSSTATDGHPRDGRPHAPPGSRSPSTRTTHDPGDDRTSGSRRRRARSRPRQGVQDPARRRRRPARRRHRAGDRQARPEGARGRGRRQAGGDGGSGGRRTPTGYVVGGISPIGQKTAHADRARRDRRALGHVFVSGGGRGLDLELAPADLIRATAAIVADISR